MKQTLDDLWNQDLFEDYSWIMYFELDFVIYEYCKEISPWICCWCRIDIFKVELHMYKVSISCFKGRLHEILAWNWVWKLNFWWIFELSDFAQAAQAATSSARPEYEQKQEISFCLDHRSSVPVTVRVVKVGTRAANPVLAFTC